MGACEVIVSVEFELFRKGKICDTLCSLAEVLQVAVKAAPFNQAEQELGIPFCS